MRESYLESFLECFGTVQCERVFWNVLMALWMREVILENAMTPSTSFGTQSFCAKEKRHERITTRTGIVSKNRDGLSATIQTHVPCYDHTLSNIWPTATSEHTKIDQKSASTALVLRRLLWDLLNESSGTYLELSLNIDMNCRKTERSWFCKIYDCISMESCTGEFYESLNRRLYWSLLLKHIYRYSLQLLFYVYRPFAKTHSIGGTTAVHKPQNRFLKSF